MGQKRPRSESESSSSTESSSGTSSSSGDDQQLLRKHRPRVKKSATPVRSQLLFFVVGIILVAALSGLYLVFQQKQNVTGSSSPEQPPAHGSTTPAQAISKSTVSTTSTSASSIQPTSTALGLSRNGIGIGFLPQQDSGKKVSMADIMKGLGVRPSYYGWYAQLPASGIWDGSQLLDVLDDVKASGAIFQAGNAATLHTVLSFLLTHANPAVMPTQG